MNNLSPMQNFGLLLARAALAFIFIVAGWTKIDSFTETSAFLTSQDLVMAPVLLITLIVIELGGGILLLLGWFARFAAVILGLLLLIATLLSGLGHWSVSFVEYSTDAIQLYKNLAILGGLLYVIIIGPGFFSCNGQPHQPTKFNKLS